jgi:hypothetical protein
LHILGSLLLDSRRGVLNNAIKLAYNPNKAQRDQLYPARINSIVNQPGIGILLFGDKTALGYASAFDRINVRRLFLTVEQALERAAQAQLFELNDELQEQTLSILLNHIFVMFKQREVFMDSLLFAMKQITLLMLLIIMNLEQTFPETN